MISYLPMRNDNVLAWLPVELSKVVENEYELNAAINDIFQGKFHNTITPSQRDKWKSVIHNIDLDSTSIISDSLANQSWDDHRQLSVASKARLVSRRYVSLLRNNIRLLNQSYRNLSFVSHGERLTKDTEILGTRSREVENKVARLIEINGFSYTFSVRNISRDVMRIAKKQ